MHTIAWHENVCSSLRVPRLLASPRSACARNIPLFALWLVAGLAHAETVATLDSPGGRLTVSVTLDAEADRATRSPRHMPVIAESRLGFILADAPKLERGFRLEGVEREPRRNLGAALGRAPLRRDRHNELRVRLVEKRAGGRRLDLVFRAFDDGVGFRYEFPEQRGSGTSASSTS